MKEGMSVRAKLQHGPLVFDAAPLSPSLVITGSVRAAILVEEKGAANVHQPFRLILKLP